MSSTGAIFVVVDPPKGLDFGIDAMSYTTGPEFRGLSSIPAGLHFVYHSTGMGARQGFFLRCKSRELIVRSWDPANEEITVKNVLKEEQVDNLAACIKRGDLNANLGPYPYDQHWSWKNLSNFISDLVLERADCLPGVMILPGDMDDIVASHTKSLHAVKTYFPDTARVARFSDIKAVEASMQEGILSDVSSQDKGRRLSSLHLDRSAIVRKIVLTYHDGLLLSLLGELQLSFLLFLVLYSYPALQYWKACIDLLCNSEELLRREGEFAQRFLRVLYEQLNFLSEDFFEDELSKTNFLVPAMSALFGALSPHGDKDSTPPLQEGVVEHRQRLLAFLRKKFGLFVFDEVVSRRKQPTEDSEELVSLWRVAQGQDGEHGFDLVEEDLPVVVSMTVETDDASSSLSKNTLVGHQQQAANDLKHAWAARLDASLPAVSSPTDVTPEIPQSPAAEKAEEKASRQHSMSFTSSSPADMERERYSWRYPALHGEMETAKKVGVEEDFIMAAARVLELAQHGKLPHDSPSVRDARLFLESEVRD